MTDRFRDHEHWKADAYGNVCRPDLPANRPAEARRWPNLIKQLRRRAGLSQAALAEELGVQQASVSRWENGHDLPSLRLRRRMRTMLQTSNASCLKQQLQIRMAYAPSPMSIVGPGARFLDFSRSFAAETGTVVEVLRGNRIYGQFGETVDVTTETWEKSGIFGGEIAFTLTVLAFKNAAGQMVHLKNFDTPYLLDDDEIVTICETRRIEKIAYDEHIMTYGSPVFFLSYDELEN